MKKRDEIEEKYKINTGELFENENAFLEEVKTVDKKIKEIKKYEGHLLQDAKTLYEALELSESLEKKVERIFVYAHLINDFDLAEEKGNEYYGTAFKLYQELSVFTSYITPELLESDYSTIEKYIQENINLKKYENVLKEIDTED